MSTEAKPPRLWGALAVLLALTGLGALLLWPEGPPAAPPLPVLAKVPPFQLQDQRGQPFAGQGLEGRVWVANFIFTRCPTICPAFTARMGQLQQRGAALGEGLRLVSFTVDPEHDTPEKLLAYAEEHRADPRRWAFVTGPRKELERVILEGMKVHMQKGSEPDDLMSIGHGSYFVLVDARLQVRGYYAFDEPGVVERVLRDAERLLGGGE